MGTRPFPVNFQRFKMLMPKKNRVAIFEHLFKEGVMVAKKDHFAPKHQELESVPNLHVIKACQSLKSKGMVSEQFAWRHYYWYLTNEGIQYLRDFLHLPPEIVPATLKRATRPEPRPREGGPSDKPRTPRGPPGAGGERQEYRRGGDKTGDAGAGAAQGFEFRGGFGRGKPAPAE